MKRAWLSLLLCLAASQCFSETLLKLPPMPEAPVVDGAIGESEWRGASMQFGAVSRKTDILARRVVYFYFGYDESNLYFAHRSGPLGKRNRHSFEGAERGGHGVRSSWKLQMSRVWCDPGEIGDWPGKEAATFIPQKGIPAVGFMGFWIYGTKAYRGQSYNFRWNARRRIGK